MNFLGKARRNALALALSSIVATSLVACSGGGDVKPTPEETATPTESTSQSPTDSSESKEVTLLAYDSFNLSDEVKAQFEKDSGYTLNIVNAGDGAELTNKLILTKDNPTGDVAYGMDNNTALSAVRENVFADSGVELPKGADAYTLEGAPTLLPVDHSDICVNYDIAWYKDKGLAAPSSYEDFLKPEYKEQLVVEDPRSSTPGLAFMLGTIEKFGKDGWIDYWKNLKANGVKVAKGWSDAFNADFTAGSNESGSAAYPLMVSYSSSPAWAVNDDLSATTIGNIPASCYEQVEYAGLLAGAKNPEGGKAVLKFLMSVEGQGDLVANNYVYPSNAEVKLPEALEKFGAPVNDPAKLSPAEVADNRETWLREWTDAIGG